VNGKIEEGLWIEMRNHVQHVHHDRLAAACCGRYSPRLGRVYL
jgi:hypothetical protein